MATRKKAKKSGKKASKKAAKKPTRKTAAKKTAKKSTRKAAPKKAARKTAKKSGKKRAPNPAFMAPMQPDAQLSEVVGNRPMPRTEVTSKLWDYIKKNNLQDPQERRMINADAKLKPVVGNKNRVSMFEMTKFVNQHLKKA
ncbi:MAG: SWIB/MDM2 domain-containing protein [Gemmatimonadota bacterium]|nr:SWIB/MDM2 domain-containing protein [Gemmatimonadota bacterium]